MPGLSQRIQRAGDAHAAFVEDMGVDHRCADVCVTHELLNRTDVIAALQEVGREGMPKSMATRRFGDAPL